MAEHSPHGGYQIIGQSVPRPDARAKATGAAVYTDDIVLPGMLHGRLLRSPLPHARILDIDTSRALALSGVKAVVTGRDLPQVRYGNWRLFPSLQDETALALDRVRFIGDEVCAVCAVDRDTAEEALSLIRVDYEELPAVFDVPSALAEGAPRLHEGVPGNVSLERKIRYGDIERGFAEADYVREDTFEVQAVSHAYLEPCSSVATCDIDGRLTLYTSTQVPYIVQCLLASVLGLRENDVRVIKPAVGGGFGGKMELRPFEVCAAFLSRRTGRPVKFTLDRDEELTCGRRRHPMTLTSRVGFRRDGTLLAKDLHILLNGGAYNAMGPTATFLCGNFGAMLYRYPAYRFLGQHVYTNLPPASAMRGFGAPQSLFASETQMNLAAEELGIDPIDLRLKNAQRPGDEIPDVATIGSCGFREALETVRRMSGFSRKRKTWPKGKGRGVGIGCYSFISGGVFNWFNTSYPFTSAEVRVFSDGTAHLLTMASDIGQGSDMVLRQILCEELGLTMNDVRLTAADTAITPQADLGTWGSRVTLMAGNAVIDAARQIKEQLFGALSARFGLNVIYDMECRNGRVQAVGKPDRGLSFGEAVALAQRANRGLPLVARGTYTPRGKGLVTPAFSFGAQVADVEVDRETGKVTVHKVYTAHDCGTVLNPMSVDGQLSGSLQMGLGYALCEELVTHQGRTLSDSFLDYKMPTALDMPAEEVLCVETYEPEGPMGAKEVGEGMVSPTAPAVADAVAHATGFRSFDLPITPEKILAAGKPSPSGPSPGKVSGHGRGC